MPRPSDIRSIIHRLAIVEAVEQPFFPSYQMRAGWLDSSTVFEGISEMRTVPKTTTTRD